MEGVCEEGERVGTSDPEFARFGKSKRPRTQFALYSQVTFTAQLRKMTTRAQSNVGFEATNCLFKLPNELLDIIALYFCGSRTILDLSCVDKRLCRIARDAMMRRLCIPKGNGVPRVLEMLEFSSPDAILKVTHLGLTKYVSLIQRLSPRLIEQSGRSSIPRSSTLG